MVSPFAQRIDRILKSGLTPILRRYRFVKSGPVYRAKKADVVWLVDVQKSRWNDEREAQFTINGGVYITGVVAVYCRSAEPAKPKIEDCCLSVRIGQLLEEGIDKWWRVTASDEPEDVVDAEIGVDVRDRVERVLLPFLHRFGNSVEVAQFLEGPIDSTTSFVSPQSLAQRHAYASLIHLRLGNTARAYSEIEEAVREAEGTPIDEVIKRLRAHVLST